MVNSLHQELTRNCIYGRSRKDAVKELEQFVSKNVKNAKYCAARVVKTETAAFSSKSQYESLLDLGCEMYEIYLPLKSTSCEICKEMNGKRFKTSEYEIGATAPPFHPNCDNGTLIPYYDDDLFKDDPPEGAEEIPDNISYGEWEKKFVNGNTSGSASPPTAPKSTTVSPSTDLTKPENSDIIQLNNFTPSKDIAEAEEYAHNILGIPNVSYKGIDVSVANEWNRGLKDTFDKFPKLKERFGFVGEIHERNTALKSAVIQYFTEYCKKNYPTATGENLQQLINEAVNKQMKIFSVSNNKIAQSFSPTISEYLPFRGITINSSYGNDSQVLKAKLKKAVDNKFHPVGCITIRSILDHEFGHQLDNLLGICNLKSIQDLYNKHTTRELTDGLSEYAWNNHNKNKFAEMIAEGWAEYCNNSTPREMAKKIGEIIENEYKKKFGKV